jgi:hypothetical protein
MRFGPFRGAGVAPVIVQDLLPIAAGWPRIIQ